MEDLSKLISQNWLSSNPLKPGRGNDALVKIIEDRIRRIGKITFAEFMELALFHAEYGYYNAPLERIGAKGDYLTSPETHPIFGALLARQLEQWWRLLGSPAKFTIVEMGAGTGALCNDIMVFSRKAYPTSFYKALKYIIIEQSPDFVARQKERFTRARLAKSKVTWAKNLNELADQSIEGCFVSNELPDAFPVHRVIKRDGKLMEIYVGLDADRFVSKEDEPSDTAIEVYFEAVGVELPEGCEGEVNLSAIEWMKNLGRKLRKGFAVTIDYGLPARELYVEKRPRGTLLCYYKHTYNENPFVRVGQQDITAHVDFTALELAGKEAGLMPVGLPRQDAFLKSLGIEDYLGSLKTALQDSPGEFRRNLRSVEELVAEDDLGKLRVLIQAKGLELERITLGLTALAPGERPGWNLPVPRLPLEQPRSTPLSWLE